MKILLLETEVSFHGRGNKTRHMKKQAGLPAIPINSGRQMQAGQTLLEILLAFSILILALGSIIFGVTTALSNTQYTKNQGLANSYAQEGMAVIRKIRDSSLNQFSLFEEIKDNKKYCLDKNLILSDGVSEAYDCNGETNGVGVNGFFSREVRFEHKSASCCSDDTQTCTEDNRGSKATVTVSWADGKCPAGTGNPLCHKVELITCFSSVDRKIGP